MPECMVQTPGEVNMPRDAPSKWTHGDIIALRYITTDGRIEMCWPCRVVVDSQDHTLDINVQPDLTWAWQTPSLPAGSDTATPTFGERGPWAYGDDVLSRSSGVRRRALGSASR